MSVELRDNPYVEVGDEDILIPNPSHKKVTVIQYCTGLVVEVVESYSAVVATMTSGPKLFAEFTDPIFGEPIAVSTDLRNISNISVAWKDMDAVRDQIAKIALAKLATATPKRNRKFN